jgi:hypothetical protein
MNGESHDAEPLEAKEHFLDNRKLNYYIHFASNCDARTQTLVSFHRYLPKDLTNRSSGR